MKQKFKGVFLSNSEKEELAKRMAEAYALGYTENSNPYSNTGATSTYYYCFEAGRWDKQQGYALDIESKDFI